MAKVKLKNKTSLAVRVFFKMISELRQCDADTFFDYCKQVDMSDADIGRQSGVIFHMAHTQKFIYKTEHFKTSTRTGRCLPTYTVLRVE
jgi:hypothetical protein